MANYGENIKARREELGMSQVQLAELIGESKQTIWKYESGTVKNIPLPKVELLAKALHCSTEYITGWQDKKGPVTESDGLEEIQPHYSGNQQKLIDLFPEMTDSEISVLLATAQAQINSRKHQDD